MHSAQCMHSIWKGDLRMSIDFREVYAALLQHWLDVAPVPIVGEQFEPINCLRQV